MVAKIGDRFVINNEDYILWKVDALRVNLICLSDGIVWNVGARIEDPNNITRAEFKKMLSRKAKEINKILKTKHRG